LNPQDDTIIKSSDEWKKKYEALVAVIRSTMGEKVLNVLISVAERNRTEGKQ